MAFHQRFTGFIVLAIFLAVAFVSCNKEPVVKSDGKPAEEKIIEIKPHDSNKIVESMPLKKTEVVANLAEDTDPNEANLVTYISALGIIVRDAQNRGFTKEDFSSPEKWNEFIAARPSTGEAFVIDKPFQIQKVYLSDKKIRDAKELYELYKPQLGNLEVGKWILVLYLDPAKQDQVDFETSFVIMKVENPSERSLNELRAIALMMHEDGNIYTLRLATRIAEQDRKRLRMSP
jgi:hypothetical protein